ncbi:hypothetical protein COCC4DRAFT_24848 [Bipolaris maydis ATCC 48331]|uniref:Uncharacterized protein n=2 Tax=Cochliobolus heterostrophus TaxID=5016 RepID=M2UTL2_COCH5|nr:uncharacterized protein COCC4DRAFT_24848 [Bipolaris maydis ATCC 48331]EMD96896.1 hypothetical protein COCHEDRAFT_1025388 [Bipolaris maydis C5]ENI03765.1 hypothetical protein COCC4DRAFT_24848 [Bipolaris maydis ATCC 48331]
MDWEKKKKEIHTAVTKRRGAPKESGGERTKDMQESGTRSGLQGPQARAIVSGYARLAAGRVPDGILGASALSSPPLLSRDLSRPARFGIPVVSNIARSLGCVTQEDRPLQWMVHIPYIGQ